MAVIPAPEISRPIPGQHCTIATGASIIADDPVLQPVADWLSAEVARFAAIDLTGDSEDAANITLVLDPDLKPSQPTLGVRADGKSNDREHYRLEVSEDDVRISGATPEGVFRGATTLLHMLTHAAQGGRAALEAQTILDAPRFSWRGLSLDVVRTFHPAETVRKVIDLLALYKMNVLHLHVTDSEGWRFEVPQYPKLTEISGQTARDGREGGHFTKEEYAGIIAYASERFITIVPEFDSPGHTASVLRAYPELGTPEMHTSPEAMQYLDPSTPAIWDLVRAVYAEMAEVHPGARIHIGGDEAVAMDDATFSAYMETALPAARATGKGIVAWQETARAGFAPGDLMQVWISPSLVEKVRQAMQNPDDSPLMQGFPDRRVAEAFAQLLLQAPEDLPKALEQGADIIVSRADKLYLDTKYVEPSANPNQEEDHQRVGLPQHVYGNGTVQEAYEWDPATIEPELPINRIAGVECAIWCETITDEHDLMFQLLPRLAGVAEKAWSSTRDWADYQPRLAVQRRFWDTMGLDYFVSSVVWPQE